MVSRLAVYAEKRGHEPPISSVGNLPFFGCFGNAALSNPTMLCNRTHIMCSIRRRLGTYLKEARDGGYRAFMKYDKVEIDKLSYELDEPSGLLKRNKTLFTYDVASQQIKEVDKGDSGE